MNRKDHTLISENKFHYGSCFLHLGDALDNYRNWPSPVVIVSDGPYGLASFPGDPPTPEGLAAWYLPHIKEWSSCSSPLTTLWFWNSEIGWATVHPVLAAHGWKYRSCHIWDKGKSHVAGNANTKTLRKFPVVTEVCVQYVREAEFSVNERNLSMQQWLRHEWARSGLPFHLANEACGVRNAATRKYLTACHLWYYPPVEMFNGLVAFANHHGNPDGRPYFSIDKIKPITGEEWGRMRAKFYCQFGISNVWKEPPVNGTERIKEGSRCTHMNQKPLRILELILKASSDPGDVVWEPFGGLCSVAIASNNTERHCYSSEILSEYYVASIHRLQNTPRSSSEWRSHA